MNTAEQYQKGDKVVYVPLNILTVVTGYVWKGTYGEEKPSLAGLELECGIAAPFEDVRRATRAELFRLDPAETN